jgi:hypothetical protein
MKKEGSIGAATFLAIAALVGLGRQGGQKQDLSPKNNRGAAPAHREQGTFQTKAIGKPACSGLHDTLQDFLDIPDLPFPKRCYVGESDDAPQTTLPSLNYPAANLRFVIALLPDPVHTHLPVLFDQFAAVVQEGAQDEKYDFDQSWLPWSDDDAHYALLVDEENARAKKEATEDQPGVILFRKNLDSTQALQANTPCGLRRYCEGLAIFVVGEDATHGIHRQQFRNALAWIAALQPKSKGQYAPVGILGPTFSGSLSSLELILSEPDVAPQLDVSVPKAPNLPTLSVFSGSVSSEAAAVSFVSRFRSLVSFHSFVHNDNEVLGRFCDFIQGEQKGFDPRKVAILSEDETAYGRSVAGDKATNQTPCLDKALRLYYPRNISALRGAYQTRSLFAAGSNPQTADTQRTTLPTDLADPSGKVHDYIESYGGSQTPLAQEALLLGIVEALRSLDARYVILSSSSTLDQLFLSNFIHRTFPNGRIVLLSSDLTFARERGATGLSGVLTLSSYPLAPLARDWNEHPVQPAADRVFSSDTAEGTYNALRLLLNEPRLLGSAPVADACRVTLPINELKHGKSFIFAPPVSCGGTASLPDYDFPRWIAKQMNLSSAACGEGFYQGPPVWMAVISKNAFWPMAALPADQKLQAVDCSAGAVTAILRPDDPASISDELGTTPDMPIGMKLFWFALVAFSIFHAACCAFGSYTAKPAFLAYFASPGDWRHSLLIFGGSCCVLFAAIVVAWGSGAFSLPPHQMPSTSSFALYCLYSICAVTWFALCAQSVRSWHLAMDRWRTRRVHFPLSLGIILALRASLLLAAAVFVMRFLFVDSIESVLHPENGVLTYWRSMYLASGVSPIVPMIGVVAGFYLAIWFNLHGLALFGPDRPRLPSAPILALKYAEADHDILRMFSQDEAAHSMELIAKPLRVRAVAITSVVSLCLFLAVRCVVGGLPIRSLGAETYALIFFVWLHFSCSLISVETWAFCRIWSELRKLLTFLDRLPLRRTFAALHGFSWGSVWKMSGNVLEVRYKVISWQMECMNHTISSLGSQNPDPNLKSALDELLRMHDSGLEFAAWYADNHNNPKAGDLYLFSAFQERIAEAAKSLLTNVLLPEWRSDSASLGLAVSDHAESDTAAAHDYMPLSDSELVRNAEQFVCLAYLGFVQNILGRLRTIALTILVLFLASTAAISAYPFDPRQGLSTLLVVVFVVVGAVIVKVYAEMHRDATLSHVTNTKPGELGTEFWFRIVGFGFAPLVGLLTRLFPGISDFILSWLQPAASSLK